MKHHVYILSHGFGNIGDFAIFKGTLRVLRGVSPSIKINVIDPLPLPKEYLDFHVEWTPYRSLFSNVPNRILSYSISGIRATLGFEIPFHAERREGVLWHRGCSGYDGYHGTLPLLLNTTRTLSITKGFSLRILGGLSLGFYRNSFERTIIKRFATSWDYILVREPLSRYYLVRAGVSKPNIYLLHDFAFNVEDRCSERARRVVEKIRDYNSGPRVAVSIRDYYYDYDPHTYSSYIRFIGSLLKVLVERFHVFLIPMSFSSGHENDIEFIKRLVEAKVIPSSVVPLYRVAYMDPEEVICLLKNFDAGIGIRTHFCILNAIAGTPVIHLYYEHKGKGIFDYSLRGVLPQISLFKAIHNQSNVIDQILCSLNSMINMKGAMNRLLKEIVFRNRLHNQKIIKHIMRGV